MITLFSGFALHTTPEEDDRQESTISPLRKGNLLDASRPGSSSRAPFTVRVSLCHASPMKLRPAVDMVETAPASGETTVSIVSSLFRGQAKKVKNFLAFRLKSVDDAEDATQEVFLKLWRHEKAGHLREEATAYMFSAAYSMATDVERHRARHDHEPLGELDTELVAEERPAIEDQRHWRDALAHLVSELKRLPESHRKAFVLHHFKGLTYEQIAKKLGVSCRTIERHMVEAHKELEVRMKDYL